MNSCVTDSMVADMDETSDFMHTTPPPFPTTASTSGIPVQRPSPLYRTKGLVTAWSKGGISIPSREQSQRDTDRNHALRIGSIG